MSVENTTFNVPAPTVVKQAEIAGLPFTINSIKRVETPDNLYHPFQWCLSVTIHSIPKTLYRFYMNPSKARNEQLRKLMNELPVHDMKLMQKEFVTDNGKGERVVYHELVNDTPFSGNKAA